MSFKKYTLPLILECLLMAPCRGDIKLQFLADAEKGDTLFSTVYASEDGPNKQWRVTLADCSAKSTTCNRDTERKTVLHRLSLNQYLSSLARYSALPERFVLEKNGDELLEESIKAAQEAKDEPALEAWNRHRTSLLRINGIRRYLKSKTESVNTNYKQAMYADTLRPYELEPLSAESRRGFQLAEGEQLELAGRKVWFIPQGDTGTLGQNEIACNNAKGTLPSVDDVQRVSKWMGESSLMRLLAETQGQTRTFWMVNRRYRFQPAARGEFNAYYHRYFSFAEVTLPRFLEVREFPQTSTVNWGYNRPEGLAVERANTDFSRWVQQTPRRTPLCVRDANPRGLTE